MENSLENTNSLVIKERLRQARLSFNFSLAMTVTTAVIGLIGISLLLTGKVSEGVLTTAGGATSSGLYLKVAKDANDRLDKIVAEFNDSI
jgi:hypothetical protein